MGKMAIEPDSKPSPCVGLKERKPPLTASAGADALAVVSKKNLEGHQLRDVINDTKSRAFCGPTTVAAITGAPISEVRNAFRLVRHGPHWVDMARAPAICGTEPQETEKVLRLFGYTGIWKSVLGSPTMAAFLESRTGIMRTHPCAVFVTGHVVAVSGWQFCDTFSKGEVVEADDAPRRRARVDRVFIITGRVPPSAIPQKDYSAAEARQKARKAYKRLIAGLGAKHAIEETYPFYQTITVTLADGKQIAMRFDDWQQALCDLKYCLKDPVDKDFKEIEARYWWYGE